jgi:deoxyribodipyrimidine photo-lyase
MENKQEKVAVVWFKRDLRMFDHQALFAASKHTSLLPIYIVEPSIWKKGDVSHRHFQFVLESLDDLQQSLMERQLNMFVSVDEIIPILDKLLRLYGPFVLYSYREHGLEHTYARDRLVRSWMHQNACSWVEFPGFAVVRHPEEQSQQIFKESWLNQPIQPLPKAMTLPSLLPPFLTSDLETLRAFSVEGEHAENPLRGGEKEAIKKANAFFQERFKKYNVYINKPFYSVLSSSQLSPYITWGNISIKALHLSTTKKLASLKQINPFHHDQLKAFYSRLHCHCHFVQVVERDPFLDTNSRDQRFDSLRIENHVTLRAFKEGKTGFPFVDACMIALRETGWINFKQRAMLASFACNTLLLDWRVVGKVLANLWLDYEPGIHWYQLQMQSGLFPDRHIPLYNVIKQSKMHDPDGQFIKKFIPQLNHVSPEFIHEPWLLETNSYHPPIVPYHQTFEATKKQLYAIKKTVKEDES